MTTRPGTVVCEEMQQQGMYADMLQAAKQIKIQDVMIREVTTAAPTDALQQAAAIMSEKTLSCLPILDDGIFKGILTQKDVLKGIGHLGPSSGQVTVAQCMTVGVQVVSPEASIYDVGRLMDKTHSKWLPVLSDEKLIGVVTQSDVTRALTSLVRAIEVSVIMSTEPATIEAAATVSAASDVMVREDISCVLAVHRDTVAGILTEKDVIKKLLAVGKDPNTTLVADVMSHPIVSVPPFSSLFSAYGIMNRKHLHRLVVMEDDRLCGILTQTDILRTLKKSLFQAEADGTLTMD